jgi:hypothetical protein
MVLGTDFLNEQEFILRFMKPSKGQGTFQFAGMEAARPFCILTEEAKKLTVNAMYEELHQEPKYDPSRPKVLTKEEAILPPFSTTKVRVKPTGNITGTLAFERYAENLEKLGICIPHFAHIPEGEFELAVDNPRSFPIKIYRGVHVGNLTRVIVREMKLEDNIRKDRIKSTQENIDQIHIIPELPEADRERLKDLIIEYGDVFAWNLDQLGKAKDTSVRINTGDALPISCAPYKKSPAEKRIIEEEV